MEDKAPLRSPAAGLLGWMIVACAGALLVSGALDALGRELPGRWIQTGVVAVFVLGHLLAFRAPVGGLTRGIGSVLFVGAAVASYRVLLGPDDPTAFTWTGISLEQVGEVLLLWTLGLGVGVLAISPRAGLARLALGSFAGLLALPWLAGVVLGRTGAEVLAGPELLSAWPWFVQPALLGLVVLSTVALLALVLTAVAGSSTGPVQPGAKAVLGALGLLLLVAPGLVAWSRLAPDARDEGGSIEVTRTPDGGVTISLGGPGSQGSSPTPGSPTPTPSTPKTRPPLPSGPGGCASSVFPGRDLDDLRTTYSQRPWRETAVQVLERRAPDAAWIVGQLNDPGTFDVWFQGAGTDTWEAMVSGLSAAVHEDVHMVGFQSLRSDSYTYPLARDSLLRTRTVPTFDRSEIAADMPPLISGMSYQETYLTGDSGAQALPTLLDELNAYTWSLQIETALLDQQRNRTSARDGLLSMMHFTQAYLHRARTKHPDVHRAIADSELSATIVTLWDRAVCALDQSGDDPKLGIRDMELTELVFGPGGLREVEPLR
jgi:hypothetical protein